MQQGLIVTDADSRPGRKSHAKQRRGERDWYQRDARDFDHKPEGNHDPDGDSNETVISVTNK